MPLTLAHLEHPAEGPETAPPLLIAHGLFGSARNFNALGRRLTRGRRVVMVDMRNHGASPWSEDCSYPAMAGDLAEAVERLCGGRAVVLGHSMGGKAAMVLALSRPELVTGLIVGDMAPVVYTHTHRGYVSAMQSVDLSRLGRRGEVDPLLAGAVPDASLRAFLMQNLVFEDGAAAWRINLGAIGRGMALLTGFPDALPNATWEGPALFLRGAASDYASPETHPAIRALFPQAEITALEGAGHWLHAERPDAFVAEVAGWLERL